MHAAHVCTPASLRARAVHALHPTPARLPLDPLLYHSCICMCSQAFGGLEADRRLTEEADPNGAPPPASDYSTDC